MSDLYLHHYASSPFSEKIRLLLGYLDLEWNSVETSIIMPRPLLVMTTPGNDSPYAFHHDSPPVNDDA